MVFNCALASSVGVKDLYPYVKGCNSGASQKISREEVVTCLAHSKERFKPSLAEYWRAEGGARYIKLPLGLKENSNSKTLIFKYSSVGSIWTCLTASPCYTTNTNKHDYTTNGYYKYGYAID